MKIEQYTRIFANYIKDELKKVMNINGNQITDEQLTNIIDNRIKNNKNAYGAREKQIPIAKSDGTWDWNNVTENYKGNILKIGGNLTLDNTPLYTTEKSIDYAVNSVANFLLNKINSIPVIQRHDDGSFWITIDGTTYQLISENSSNPTIQDY